MIVVVIVGGCILGWGVGNYFLDRWLNDNNEDINKN
jgi:hypothetical protein